MAFILRSTYYLSGIGLLIPTFLLQVVVFPLKVFIPYLFQQVIDFTHSDCQERTFQKLQLMVDTKVGGNNDLC